MKLRHLEMALERVRPYPNPSPQLEQYSTPATVAARVLFDACSLGDIVGKRIADLGTGSGILAIGAKLLGAGEVVGVDVDPGIIEWARGQAREAGVDASFQCIGIEDLFGEFDTVLTNPPFGSQSRHADRPFIEKAIQISGVGYSFHLSGTIEFVEKMIYACGARITHATNYKFRIPHMFDFHRKASIYQDVTVVRFERS